MAITKKVKDEMLQRFQDQYGIMKPALHYNSPFELMIAVILSAQCTDERVNIVTAGLFPEYNTAEKMLSLGLDGLEASRPSRPKDSIFSAVLYSGNKPAVTILTRSSVH